MFLTSAEVAELTGAKTKAGQVVNLKRNGVRHTIKASGWPSVTTAAIIASPVAHEEKPAWKPRKAG